jgi:hypothetical protein
MVTLSSVRSKPALAGLLAELQFLFIGNALSLIAVNNLGDGIFSWNFAVSNSACPWTGIFDPHDVFGIPYSTKLFSIGRN